MLAAGDEKKVSLILQCLKRLSVLIHNSLDHCFYLHILTAHPFKPPTFTRSAPLEPKPVEAEDDGMMYESGAEDSGFDVTV